MNDGQFALGLIAGEGCFTVNVDVRDYGVYLYPAFSMPLHERDKELLQDFMDVLGFGETNLHSHRSDIVRFNIQASEDVEKLRKFIDTHRCKLWESSEKSHNFEVWSDLLPLARDGSPEAKIKLCERAKELNSQEDDNWDEVQEAVKDRYDMNE